MMTKIEDFLGALIHDKLPPLSENHKKLTVRFLPLMIIIFGVIGLLAILSILGLFSATAALTASTTGVLATHFLTTYDLILIYILSPLSAILAILSGYWMFNQELRGWRLALISSLLGFIIHLLHISLFGMVLDLIFIYLLFQIREFYNN